MFSESKVSVIAVVIPIIHVLVCAIFLWGYCLGFGVSLNIFAASTDIFAVSLSDVIGIYFSALIVPFLINLNFFVPEKPGDEAQLDLAKIIKHGWIAKLGCLGIIGLIVASQSYVVLHRHQEPHYPVFTIAVGATLFFLFVTYSARLTYSRSRAASSLILVLFVSSALFSGMSSGSRDRRLIYSSNLLTLPNCRQNLIMRRLSENYLVVRRDGSKVIVDKDCVAKFRFPNPRTFSERTGFSI